VEGESELDVQLRNPEYDLTSNIKKVLYGFQAGGSLFANVQESVEFIGYVSADNVLPPALAEYRDVLQGVLEELGAEGGEKFSAEIVDPQAGDGSLARQIQQEYGLQPMAASLFDEPFYFYLTLTDGNTLLQVPLPDALSAQATRRGIEEGLKRFAAGVLKTVALSAPQAPPPMMGMQQPQGNSFSQLREFLQQSFNVVDADLADGAVPDEAELLMIVDPESLDERQVFAVDQFLMKGGTVALATGRYSARFTERSITASERSSGLEDWLEHHGVTVGEGMVMDPQNAAFPAPVTRQVGGFSFQELVMLDYPYFIDVRPPGLNEDVGITAGLPQVTMAWASPLETALDEDAAKQLTPLLESSPESWISTEANVMPRVSEGGLSGFESTGPRQRRTLAVMLEGRFQSYFAGQPSPLLQRPESEQGDTSDEGEEPDEDGQDNATTEDELGVVTSVIERSPESARLFVLGSNDFLADQVLRVIGSAEGTVYGNSVQLLANVVDFSLEDRNLLEIRSRGHFNRTLPSMQPTRQATLEMLNYGMALGGVGLVFLWHRRRVNRDEQKYGSWLAEGSA
jgi:ABC-2 type transport system permease protein